MEMNAIIDLLHAVCANYPTVKRNIERSDGSISDYVLDEWKRQIGFLDYDEALERLDTYMASEAGAKPPKPMDLRKTRNEGKIEYFHADLEHQWHLVFPIWDVEQMHGRLFDEEDREYGEAGYEDGYHYNQVGLICTIDGRVVV